MASDVTSETQVLTGNTGHKCIMLKSGVSLTGATDYMDLDLTKWGISKILAVQGFVHTTDYSVMVTESGTTAVSAGGTLRYTTAAGNNNKRRVVLVFCE